MKCPVPSDSSTSEFFRRTERDGACLLWLGRLDRWGYGRTTRGTLAHRFAFAVSAGTWDFGPLDHVCRNRRCVERSHLRETTPALNAKNNSWALATHCVNGHAWDEANTYRHAGRRFCRACNRRHARAYRSHMSLSGGE